MGTRDDMCGIDVARMAELGGFAEEITIIGCVYKQDGDVLYRVTDDPTKLTIFTKMLRARASCRRFRRSMCGARSFLPVSASA